MLFPENGIRAREEGADDTSGARPRRVGGPPRWAWKPRAWARVEPPRVQILVVVANIQTRTLKAEVEKGSM